MCNTFTTSSVRLFVNLFREVDEDDDDGASLSSCSRSHPPPLNPSVVMEDDGPPGIVELFDDDEGMYPKQKPDQMRKKAKRLKKRVQALEQERDALLENEKKHFAQHSKIQERLQNIDEELGELNDSCKLVQRSLDHARVELQREKLARTRAQESLAAADKRANLAQVELKAIQENHAKQLQNAQVESMAEVRSVLTQHRELVEENKRLKDRLFKVTDRYEREQRQWRDRAHKRVDDDLERDKLEAVQKTRNAAKLWTANQRSAMVQEERQAASLEAHTRTHVRNAPKMSGQAARISLAAMKVAHHSTIRSSTIDVPPKQEKENKMTGGSLFTSSLSLAKKKRAREAVQVEPSNTFAKVRKPPSSKPPRQAWGSLLRPL